MGVNNKQREIPPTLVAEPNQIEKGSGQLVHQERAAVKHDKGLKGQEKDKKARDAMYQEAKAV